MIVFCILLTLFYASHSILATTTLKQKLRNSYSAAFRFYRIFYTLFSGVFFTFIVWWFIQKHEYHFLFKSVSVLKYLGIVMAVSGLLFTGWGVLRYGIAEFTGINSFFKIENSKSTEKPTLNKSGINSWVRHPIYTGIVFAMFGLLLLLPTKMTLMAIIITSVYLEIGIRLEEQKLIEEFGSDYEEYRKRVKKIIPFVY